MNMSSEFFLAIEEIEREKGIPKDYMIEKITQALAAVEGQSGPPRELLLILTQIKGK